MPNNSQYTKIFHITDVKNLAGIISSNGLKSDAQFAQGPGPAVIGYSHIKQRRLTAIAVPCCQNRFVGEFVPFYFCARSPMLFTINKGNTGLPPGCQQSIVHLVSTVEIAVATQQAWAISDGNAGSFAAAFSNQLVALNDLDWTAIDANNWAGKSHEKAAELLVADFFPWNGIQHIGCHNKSVAAQVVALISKSPHKPTVTVQNDWYY